MLEHFNLPRHDQISDIELLQVVDESLNVAGPSCGYRYITNDVR